MPTPKWTAVQINPLPNLPVPLGIGHMLAQFLGMRAGVSDLYIRGRLRIMLKPLMSQMPVVGAIKVFCPSSMHATLSAIILCGSPSGCLKISRGGAVEGPFFGPVIGPNCQ